MGAEARGPSEGAGAQSVWEDGPGASAPLTAGDWAPRKQDAEEGLGVPRASGGLHTPLPWFPCWRAA